MRSTIAATLSVGTKTHRRRTFRHGEKLHDLLGGRLPANRKSPKDRQPYHKAVALGYFDASIRHLAEEFKIA